MKINLKVKRHVIGYSAMHGVKHTQIKIRDTRPCTTVHMRIIDHIRNEKGAYYQEWRMVKEKEGFIFREVLHDGGVSGHHKTIKDCLLAGTWRMELFVDEPFEHESLPEFQKMKVEHMQREGRSKYPNLK